MLQRILFIFLAISFSLTEAYTLPAGVVDGVYTVYMKDGKEIHKKIKDFPVSTELKVKRTTPSTKRQAGPNERFHCGCGHNMNHANCDQAVAALKGQLAANINNYFGGNYSFYVIRGSVVAFICSQAGNKGVNYGHPVWYAQNLAKITQACGWYVAGTLAWTDVDSQNRVVKIDEGYMNHYPGLSFCAAARGSGATSC